MTTTSSFFRSRWVRAPDYLMESQEGGLPKGFRAAGVACGIKEGGALDLSLLVSDAEVTTSAARFTRSGTQSAPVLLCMERCDLGGIRAVVVNSGNANAATGLTGLEDAAKMQREVAAATGMASENAVAVASTGVIGMPMLCSMAVRSITPTLAFFARYPPSSTVSPETISASMIPPAPFACILKPSGSPIDRA